MSDLPNTHLSPFERLVRSRWYGTGGIQGLSKVSGVSRATLYSWFRGETTPDAKSLARLSGVLDISVAELVEAIGAVDPGSIRYPQPAASLPRPQPPRTMAPSGIVSSSGSSWWRRARAPQTAVQDAAPPADVAWCNADDPIGPVARTLYEHHYSQMPVRDGDQWIALLTTEAIARWMAGRGRHDLEVESRAPVREVLAYADDAADFRVAARDASAQELLAHFDSAANRGQPIKAVVLVDPASNQATGIVTAHDLPRFRYPTTPSGSNPRA